VTGAHPNGGITIRAATPADLPDAHRIWRDAIDDYTGRLGGHPLPRENPGVMRLHAHCLATDPTRFQVAVRNSIRGEGRVVGFGSAVDRGPLWFLSMLFVDPGEQARGLGRALLGRLLGGADAAGLRLATATDSAQPISNALYASIGIVPRVPLLHLLGRREPGREVPGLPGGVTASPLWDGGEARAGAEVDALDREVIGFAHPEDHGYARAGEGQGFGYRDGSGSLLGYGYASMAGRIGPIAAREPDLVAAIFGHLLTAVEPRGASSIWLPGTAGPTVVAALRAGLRLDGFPVLLCWDRPFADLARYSPISPGLL